MSSHSNNNDNLAESLSRENDSAEFLSGLFTYDPNSASLLSEYLATQWEQAFGTQYPSPSDEICGEDPENWTEVSAEPEGQSLGGESSILGASQDSHAASPSDESPQPDPDGDVPDNSRLRVIQYCNPASHAKFLRSPSAPKIVGIERMTQEDLMASIIKFPQTYGSLHTLKRYSAWAAEQAGPSVKKEDICPNCFWKYNIYYREHSTMVRKKEKDGKVYWTDDYSAEAAEAMLKASSYNLDDGEIYHPASISTQGNPAVEAWLGNLGKSEQKSSQQEASASYGYPADRSAIPISANASWTNPFNIQEFEPQSFYNHDYVVTSHQRGESSEAFPGTKEWTEEEPPWNPNSQQQSPDVVGKYVELPPAPAMPNPMRIPYCSLQSHAQYLVSDAGPSTMGIRGRSVEFAEEKLNSMHDVYGGPKVIRWYGKWAAEQAGVKYKPICQKCYIAHRDYFFQGGKYEGTCYCNPDPTAGQDEM
ncbi:hypothetical protein FFLO_04435 [Filobasidium floriforme]|uniref:Uncharacterized protein n=1 Tax=Filobasidium floriforme TaxID=5210 RepID=A0A8K0NP95_9TREE|nr:uncharacterized protein HD553DRAFT_334081 [Filobasidium floriforme]KAG7531314.1 hypothetical protein FFLO_04435 [Filobasidium floriforme]KAH8088564.1 hypothetical protein HD553DRAFT_334081 [Filobasidium floriforme]